jgi:hypothetical protein
VKRGVEEGKKTGEGRTGGRREKKGTRGRKAKGNRREEVREPKGKRRQHAEAHPGITRRLEESRVDSENEQKQIKLLQKTKQGMISEISDYEKKISEKQKSLAALTEAISAHIKEAENTKFEEHSIPTLKRKSFFLPRVFLSGRYFF